MIRIVNKYKEPNHIYCGRGSPLGNPFVLHDPSNSTERDKVCDQYAEYFKQKVAEHADHTFTGELVRIEDMARAGDINLGCFCAPRRCHCETIKTYIEQQLKG